MPLMAKGLPCPPCCSGCAGFLEGQEGFDVIHVGAAADELPDELVRALNPRGRMVIPVGPQGSTQVRVCPHFHT